MRHRMVSEVEKKTRPKRARLRREAWIDAALQVMAETGIGAVAVESLAQGLGVTKGSFYWHFANRDALVDAALATWEQRGTREIIRTVSEIDDPHAQLVALAEAAIDDPADLSVEFALSRAREDPRVKKVLDRVVQSRMTFLIKLFRRLGLPLAVARRRAVIAYSLVLGQEAMFRTLAIEDLSTRRRRELALDVASMLASQPGD
jgi:AcrR family transcriptional regulator